MAVKERRRVGGQVMINTTMTRLKAKKSRQRRQRRRRTRKRVQEVQKEKSMVTVMVADSPLLRSVGAMVVAKGAVAGVRRRTAGKGTL
jgi:uncharacterized protein YqhQ